MMKIMSFYRDIMCDLSFSNQYICFLKSITQVGVIRYYVFVYTCIFEEGDSHILKICKDNSISQILVRWFWDFRG